MAQPTPNEIANVRRECVGNATDDATLSDDDVIYWWENGGAESILLTAALCADMLAIRVGGTQILSWSADGESINKTMQPAEWRRRAAELRRAADTGRRHFGTVATLAHVINDETADEFGFGIG